MKNCKLILKRLPKECPLIGQCDIFSSTCKPELPVKHPEPCYGEYCTCEIALDGGKVEEIKKKRKKRK